MSNLYKIISFKKRLEIINHAIHQYENKLVELNNTLYADDLIIEIETRIEVFKGFKKDLLDEKNTGIPARFRSKQIELFI